MSLITSCPACATTFRVVPDQLKISDGWVRCGHCGEVFDATAHLGDESDLTLARPEPQVPAPEQASAPMGLAVPAVDPDGPPEPAGSAPAAAPPAAEAALPEEPTPSAATLLSMPDSGSAPDAPLAPAEEAAAAADLPAAADPAASKTEAANTQAAEAANTQAAGTETGGTTAKPAPRASEPLAPERAPSSPISSFFGSDSLPLEPSPLDSPFVFRRSDLGDLTDSSIQPPAPRAGQSATEEDEEPTAAELNEVSFVKQARREAFWRQPRVRIGLVVASVLLTLLLVLQFAWQDRDRLALAQPALQPVLRKMCDWLNCTVGAPRQIEAIVIESSGFNRLHDDTYRLGFTLRNTSRGPVALPAMELTVTDAQDQPIVRRVLLPEELGAPAGALIPGQGDWSRTLALAVDAPPSQRVAGYRLLAFYP